MPNSLSIRSYSRQRKGHAHDHHQLVFPVRGVINIEVESFRGKVIPGECVIVKSGEMHYFDADSEAIFIVADLDNLPHIFEGSETIVFSVTPPLRQFLIFAEAQLKHQFNQNIESLMLQTIFALLSEQRLSRKRDQRVCTAIEYIDNNLAQKLSVSTLAGIACLSPTQFKKVFKQQTEYTVSEYITKLRMEKAQALLTHTDYPLQIVAEFVGYSDLSAFSRRFSKHFGMPPSKITR